MKEQVIQKMLADPEFDPSLWLGKALISYMQTNYRSIMEDPVARKHLIKGAEATDIDKIADKVIQYYQTDQDEESFALLIDSLADLFKFQSSNPYGSGHWSLRRAALKVDKVIKGPLVSKYLEIRMAEESDEPSQNLLDQLDEERSKLLVKNRDQRAWFPAVWRAVLRPIPDDKLWDYFQETVWPRLNTIRGQKQYDWPRHLQTILFQFSLRLPDNRIKDWLNFIETTDVEKHWKGQDSDRISKAFTGEKLTFSRQVCRCGNVAANKGGHSTHQNHCEYDELGSLTAKEKDWLKPSLYSFNLYQSAKLLYAPQDPLTCNQCGKTCKTASGLSLHSKKCEDPRGAALMRLKEQHREEDLKILERREEFDLKQFAMAMPR